MNIINEINRSFTTEIFDNKHDNNPNFVNAASDNEKTLTDFNINNLLMSFVA